MSNPVSPPAIPTGRDLYDTIMGAIEPELTTAGMQTLDAKYKGETKEQLVSRQARYDIAFAQYNKAYAGYIEALSAQATRYSKEAFAKAELEHRAEDEQSLDALSQAIFQSA